MAQPKFKKNWLGHYWPSQSEKKFSWANYGWAKFLAGPLLAQPKFGKNWPSQILAGPILAAGPVLGFSPTLVFFDKNK
jgi:hypothetical protein